jgi:hypothetical protein
MIFGLFVTPLLLAETSFFSDQRPTPWVVVNVLSYPLIITASIALHELGHAAAARTLGLRVLGVRLGFERRIAMWRWGSTRVQLTAFPYRAWTFLGANHLRGLRWRLWLSMLAGPLATLAILWGVLVGGDRAVSDVIWPRGEIVSRLATVTLIGFANFWLLVWNLVPYKRRAPTGASDGMQLLRIPRLTDRELTGMLVAPPVSGAGDHSETDDPEAEHRALEAELARAPGSWESRNIVGYLHIQRAQLAEARAVFLELLEEPPPTPEHGWLVRNNLAWTDFRLRQPDLQAEADEQSTAVLEHLRGVPFAMGTRGAVLGWMGQHDEAIELLEGAFAHAKPKDRAQLACCLAISWAAIGWPTEARYWLGLARANHANCPLLGEATVAVDRRPKEATPTASQRSG